MLMLAREARAKTSSIRSFCSNGQSRVAPKSIGTPVLMNTTVLRRLGTVARRATTVSNIGTVNWRRSQLVRLNSPLDRC